MNKSSPISTRYGALSVPTQQDKVQLVYEKIYKKEKARPPFLRAALPNQKRFNFNASCCLPADQSVGMPGSDPSSNAPRQLQRRFHPAGVLLL